MGNLLLITSLWLVTFVVQARATGGCSAGKGVCVESRYCRGGTRNSSKLHKCFLPNMKHGVCCEECTTARGGPGVCIGPEQCKRYTKNLQLDQKTPNEGLWWKKTSAVCHETKTTKFYCCPTKGKKSVTKNQPERRAKLFNDNAFPPCQTPTNETGRCVPLKLCDTLHEAFWDSRNHPLIQDSICPSDALHSTSVCCPDPANPDSLIRHPNAKMFDLNQCGNVSMSDRVLGGSVADLGQYPWMVNIMYHRKRRKVNLCSGTLIHPRYVLSAAHCSKRGVLPISVRLGEYDLSKRKDCVGNVCAQQIIERTIDKWIPHEAYSGMTAKADIALVKLSIAAKIIPGQISPICLPLTEQWLMTKPSKLTVSGWGQMGNKRFSDVLMHTQLVLLPMSVYCREEDQICARGYDMEGHCQGDSGGPLQQIVNWGNKYRMVLFGVVSGGAAECSKTDTVPGVSMLVGYYLRWILDNMEW